MQGRLNSFQRTMLQWNDLYPYNAVHVVRIARAFDLDHLRKVIDGSLETWGLTGLTLNRKTATYRYQGGPALGEIQVIESGADCRATLALEIEHQLNTAFALAGRINPFRFLVEPGPDFFWLGLVYFHVVADAESIVMLLKQITDTYTGKPGHDDFRPIKFYPKPRGSLLSRPALLARKICSLPSQVGNMRSSCRPPCHDARDQHNGFDFFTLDAMQLPALGRAAKLAGVTLNDLFLALLLKSVSPLAPNREQSERRKKISVGCIVNLRKDLGLERQRTFGVFLGSFAVTHEAPDGLSAIDLAKDIGRRTRALKEHKLYLAAPMELGLARFTLSYSTSGATKFYQKHYPLWGGITNMNFNALWGSPDKTEPVDYFRAVSTGPATPLVLSVTTVGNHANIGLTYRSTIFSKPNIERIKGEFFHAVQQVETGA